MPTSKRPPTEALPGLPAEGSGEREEGAGGIAYLDAPNIDDAERLPRDPMAALDKLTQLNGPSASRGASACGAAVLVAALLVTRGYAALLKLAEAIRGELSDASYAELKGPAEDVARGGAGATYGALAEYASVIQRRYRSFDGGMSHEKLRHLMALAGLQPPRFINDDSIGGTLAGGGRCWPAKIVIEGGDEGNHWILVGRDARGLFVYDPYPRADGGQIIRPGEADWKIYAAAIGRDAVGRDTIGFLPKS